MPGPLHEILREENIHQIWFQQFSQTSYRSEWQVLEASHKEVLSEQTKRENIVLIIIIIRVGRFNEHLV